MAQTRPAGPDVAALQTEPEVAFAGGGGYGINVSTTDSGFAVQYSTPSGHEPNSAWDWVAVFDGSQVPAYADLGSYVAWNWVCPTRTCASTGTAVVDFEWKPGATYTIVYFTWKWNVVANDTITTPSV